MRSKHPESALVPYLRGELNAGERASVGRHLAECRQCRESVDSFAAILARLPSRLDEMPTPEWTAYRAELHAKLAARESSRAQRWGAGALWGALATGAAAAAIAVSLLMLRGGGNVPVMDQFALDDQIAAADLGLLRNYALVERLDLLENYDVIEHLDELAPAEANHESPS